MVRAIHPRIGRGAVPSGIRGFLFLCAVSVCLNSCAHRRLQNVSATPGVVTSQAFREELATVARTPWTEGNALRAIENGGRFFPVMLEAVERAQRSITFESFMNIDGQPTYYFSNAFAERARAGVKVHLVLDWMGSRKWGDDLLEEMRDAGVEIEFYSPMEHPLQVRKYNHRTHRRVLVVDGKVGYTGAMGWAGIWCGFADSKGAWRDTAYEMRGPVVAQLQDNFNDNWEELRGIRLEGPDYYPVPRREGSHVAQMMLGSPRKQVDTVGSSYLLAIRAARDSILIAQSYFVPTPAIRSALLEAARRGVHIEILLPGRELSDVPVIHPVTNRDLRRLHKAGIELYEYQRTMLHGKALVIDGYLTIVGAANIDPRSFFINDENNLQVLSSSFARRLIEIFEADKEGAVRQEREDFRLRGREIPQALLWRPLRSQL